jgi:hypothetical protein
LPLDLPPSRKKHIIIIRKTLTPTSEQLSKLPLKAGANTITFRWGGRSRHVCPVLG